MLDCHYDPCLSAAENLAVIIRAATCTNPPTVEKCCALLDISPNGPITEDDWEVACCVLDDDLWANVCESFCRDMADNPYLQEAAANVIMLAAENN